MDHALCKLTLVYPPAIEGFIVDVLLGAEPPLAGFTSWTADGHGLDFSRASAHELVRGRVRRGVMVLVLARDRLPALLALIKSNVSAPGLVYWIEPVEVFEHLTLVDDQPRAETTAGAAAAAAREPA